MRARNFFILCSVILLFGCKPVPAGNEYREKESYPHSSSLRSTVAYLVIEKNDQPYIMASGFLADREKGIFYNAKHFTDDIGVTGPSYCKIFLNGKVYRAEVVKVPPLRDASLLRIISDFNPDDLPDPLPIATEMPKIGEEMFILGFHPHVYDIREENAREGFADKAIPILKTYYDITMKDKSKESEVVFDNLPGTRVRPDPKSVMENKWLTKEEKMGMLEFENDRFIKVRMARDHKFSFGGLSGGLAMNGRGEVVGINTAQDIFRFEYDEFGFFSPEHGLVEGAHVKKQFFDVMYITPIDSLQDLASYIKSIS